MEKYLLRGNKVNFHFQEDGVGAFHPILSAKHNRKELKKAKRETLKSGERKADWLGCSGPKD